MLDLKLIRNTPDVVRKALSDRQDDPGKVDRLLALDSEFRQGQRRIDTLREERNRASKTIGAIKTGKAEGDVAVLQEDMRKLGDELKGLEERQKEIELERTDPAAGILFTIPNIPHDSVPVGPDESANVEVRRWGEIPRFEFAARPHEEIGEGLKMLDLARATKLAGARFVLQLGGLARLERALINLMLDLHGRAGYTEVMPPAIASEETLTANGNLPKFKDQLFKLEDWPYYLIPTAEVPLTNIRRGEIVEAFELPMRLTAYTPCFRSEAGAAGRDTKGIIRVHQFDKVELVKIVRPEDSYDELETMVQSAEKVLQTLGLPYRVVLLSTGDLGFNSAKTYDLEVWFPGQDRYREISSCSNCTDFQARRGQTRFRDDGQIRFPHTLNGSGLAVGRCLAAILENFQRQDGSVALPEALHPYMGGMTELRRA